MTRTTPLDARTPRPSRGPRLALLAGLALVLALGGGAGCATRTVEDRIINRYDLDVYLRSDKKPFRAPIDHGYAQPSDISTERLEVILGSLEIEERERARTVRRPAIPAEILQPISQALAEAFREADSSERIAVVAKRKEMQKKIFHRKYLTTFVTWMEGDDLIFHLSRSDWPIDEDRRIKNEPQPHVDDPQQKFVVMTNEYVRRSGRTGVAVAWGDDVFGDLASAAAVRAAPVSSGAGAPAAASGGEKTVLMESSAGSAPEPQELTSEQLARLSAEDLRALADLEEARSQGRVTEADYRRRRAAIVGAATAD